jgi:hypothetical protein
MAAGIRHRREAIFMAGCETVQGLSERLCLAKSVRKRNRKKHLHFLEKYAKLTKLWHDSDEARGCCP